MSALRDAVEHMASAGLLLEQIEPTVPAYSTDALRFIRAELGVVRRRLSNLRRALGDLDDALAPTSQDDTPGAGTSGPVATSPREALRAPGGSSHPQGRGNEQPS